MVPCRSRARRQNLVTRVSLKMCSARRKPADVPSVPRFNALMPYWSVYCLYCGGYVSDALLECVPPEKRSSPAYRLLFLARAGAAYACPYCDQLIGFDSSGQPTPPQPGWPVFRLGRAEHEIKRQADGEAIDVSLADWALRHRFTSPGSCLPLVRYTFAEEVSDDEIAP
jgi:hypothetical protein